MIIILYCKTPAHVETHILVKNVLAINYSFYVACFTGESSKHVKVQSDQDFTLTVDNLRK